MFLIMGINTESKELDFNQMVICDECKSYGRYIVYMTYSVLSLFFIPAFKWNKKYYVRMSCCDTLYQLHAQIGKQIEDGNSITIQKEDLTLINKTKKNHCLDCGYILQEDFEFCPKCGRRL
ncbi:MAG: zinc ribbon domain-containing protein [Holdemanella sp.]|nr:zinc ribbon domain-containing protein [Holdemanella sp.]